MNNSTKKDKAFDTPEDWISQAEAARIRGVSQQAIKNLITRGRLLTFEIGGKILVKRSEVESFEAISVGRPPKKDIKTKSRKK